jgi:hypothetical protein
MPSWHNKPSQISLLIVTVSLTIIIVPSTPPFMNRLYVDKGQSPSCSRVFQRTMVAEGAEMMY